VPHERSGAFAPGRVNLIGEHTDYNRGLALPFAIGEGVTVHTRARDPDSAADRILAHARDLDETDEFDLAAPPPAPGWRAFVRGTVAELAHAGYPLRGAHVDIAGDVPLGGGLSSSAALEVALCLALIRLGADTDDETGSELDRTKLAQLCARVEHRWVGARTGLLDQLASLYGRRDAASLIDFATLRIEHVPLRLGSWRLAVADSGERHVHASSPYNQRRAECQRASELLGVASLREAEVQQLENLPEPLRARARHVLSENERVLAAAEALRSGDLLALGALLNRSHASLRDCYEVSTAAVERTVRDMQEAGAVGARMIGGGFGGYVLGLFAPSIPLPDALREVRPGGGAHLLGA